MVDGPASLEILGRVAAQTGEPDRAVAALETCSRYRMRARYLWATRRLLLRFFGSIQCSTRCEMIRVSKNSSSRHERSIKPNGLLYETSFTQQSVIPSPYPTLSGQLSLGVTSPFHSRRKRLRRFQRATAVSGIQRRKCLRWKALLMFLMQLISHSLPKSLQNISTTL